ncbi:hypothetical protein REPUB_Repub18cG0125000 [Reevesia pubescens]
MFAESSGRVSLPCFMFSCGHNQMQESTLHWLFLKLITITFSDDVYKSMQNGLHPQVNLNNVLTGLFAIVTGCNKGCPSASVNQLYKSSNVSFLGYLTPLFYIECFASSRANAVLHLLQLHMADITIDFREGFSAEHVLKEERFIPLAVPKKAKELAILTVVKDGVLIAYKLETGLVIARRSDGTWFAPSAIFFVGLGCGAQVRGELMDFIIVLYGSKAVKKFCSRMHLSLGAGCSVAPRFVGRVLKADLRAGNRGFTYNWNIVATRMDTNLRYGDLYLTIADILLKMVNRPKDAKPLYIALDDLYSSICC